MVGFPLLLIPLALYNIIVFLMPGVSFADPLLKLMLVSGTEWVVTLSDILLALGILLLLFEVIKGARPGAKFLTDHLLSLIVFGAAAAEFVMWSKFGNSTYFLLTLLALVDFLSGLALRVRRGTVVASAPAVAGKNAQTAETPAAEPQFVPVVAPPPPVPPPPSAPPAPSVPPAASVAESVLLDHPEPKLAQAPAAPEAAPTHVPPAEVHSAEVHPAEVPSPEVPSPGIQPGSGSQPSPDKPDTPQR